VKKQQHNAVGMDADDSQLNGSINIHIHQSSALPKDIVSEMNINSRGMVVD